MPFASVATSIPLIAISLGGVGVIYGTYDLSYTAVSVVAPTTDRKGQRAGSLAIWGGRLAGLGAAAGTIGIRERFFLPTIPAPPQLAPTSAGVVERVGSTREKLSLGPRILICLSCEYLARN